MELERGEASLINSPTGAKKAASEEKTRRHKSTRLQQEPNVQQYQVHDIWCSTVYLYYFYDINKRMTYSVKYFTTEAGRPACLPNVCVAEFFNIGENSEMLENIIFSSKPKIEN